MRFIGKILAAINFLAYGLAAISPLLLSLAGGDGESRKDFYTFLAVFGIATLVILAAPTVRRAFGRSHFLTGVLFLVLPISTVVLPGRAWIEGTIGPFPTGMGDAGQSQTVGSDLAGSCFWAEIPPGFGPVLGAVFLFIGLFLILSEQRGTPSARYTGHA